MKRSTAVMFVILGTLVGLGTGAIGGALVMQRTLFAATAEEDAWNTLERVEVLSRLRLDQPDLTIELLEAPLGETVLFMSKTYDDGALGRDSVVFRALLAAKAYFQIYPPTGADATAVDNALAHIPLLQDKDRYTDGVNALVERFQPVPLAPSVGT